MHDPIGETKDSRRLERSISWRKEWLRLYLEDLEITEVKKILYTCLFTHNISHWPLLCRFPIHEQANDD